MPYIEITESEDMCQCQCQLPQKCHRSNPSNRAVTTSRPAPLQRIDDPPQPVLEKVRNVTEGVAVREKVPATGTVAVVVEPGAENKVGGDAEEKTVDIVSCSPQCDKVCGRGKHT